MNRASGRRKSSFAHSSGSKSGQGNIWMWLAVCVVELLLVLFCLHLRQVIWQYIYMHLYDQFIAHMYDLNVATA